MRSKFDILTLFVVSKVNEFTDVGNAGNIKKSRKLLTIAKCSLISINFQLEHRNRDREKEREREREKREMKEII